jgi:NADH-quinone oxidoreductase subunit L
VLLAAAAKSAQVPFSPWLFAAMAGPTPVSALLHSATLVAAGAYLLIRLSPALEGVAWFLPAVALVGIVTTLTGGLVAAVQTHAKRVLAASTSAQYGLMFVAVGAGVPAAAAAQLVTHAVFKSLLFLGAGMALHAAGTEALGRLRLGRVLPATAVLSGIGALALAAVPPFGGAWSKEQIVAGALEANLALGAVLLGVGFLSAFYAARYQLLAFGLRRPGNGPGERTSSPGRVEIAAMGILAAVTVGLSLLWLPGARAMVEDLTLGPLPHGAAWEVLAGLAAVLTAFVLVAWLDRQGRLLTLGLSGDMQASLGDWAGLPAALSTLVARPTLVASARLRAFDDRVVDAGVRRAAWVAGAASALVSRRIELPLEATVRGIGWGALRAADASRVADDSGVDAAVEATGRGVGLAGHQSRRLQGGQSHHYFVIVVAGVGLIVLALVVLR